MVASPVSAIPIAQLTDIPDLNANAVAVTNALDHLLVPKYATTAARDAANTAPVEGDICYVTGRGYMSRTAVSTWLDFNNKITAFRTATLSIATTKTTYVSMTVPVGTWYIRASFGINNNAANAHTQELDWTAGGVATITYTNTLIDTTNDLIFFSSGLTAFGTVQTAPSSNARFVWINEGIMVVTTAGLLTVAATATTSAKTADGGGYLIAERWA